MALRFIPNGSPNVMMPNGGGTFSPYRDQTPPERTGVLCIFAPAPEGDCCGEGCCGDPGCEEPVPETAVGDGAGGVADRTIALRFASSE